MNNPLRKIFKGDTIIWTVFVVLILLSVLQVFSAISYLAYRSTSYVSPIQQHIRYLIIGIIITFLFVNVKWFRPTTKFFRLLSYFGLLGSWGLLLYVLTKERIGDAARFLALGPISFQPSELAKFFLIITVADMLDTESCMLAYIVSRIRGYAFSFNPKQQFGVLLVMLAVTCVLIAVENLSTALLLGGVIFVMLCLSNVSWEKIFTLLATIILFMTLCWGVSKLIPDDMKSNNKAVEKVVGFLHRFPTWESRIVEFVKSDDETKFQITDKNLQVVHAQRAIARGGIAKFGPGTSIERDYLPNAYNDFIFAIVIEEYGLVGGVVVIFLFLLLLGRAPAIAWKQKSSYATLLVFGSAFIIVFQAIINMAVSVSFGPVTGQPLPLMSKGGTSIVFVCAYFGMILNLSNKEIKDENLIEIKDGKEDDEFQILD